MLGEGLLKMAELREEIDIVGFRLDRGMEGGELSSLVVVH